MIQTKTENIQTLSHEELQSYAYKLEAELICKDADVDDWIKKYQDLVKKIHSEQ